MRKYIITDLPEDWEPIASIFAAMGDSTRQRILLLFEPGERLGLKTIVDVLPLSRTAVVHHLHVLEQAGLITARREGREVLYGLNLPLLLDALDKVREYAQSEMKESAD